MNSRSIAVVYSAAIFVSAFLLFQIQPLISKCLLPWFGGTPNVWTTCLLFFQTVLFGGYVYAHLLSRRLSPAWQALVHCLLLGAAVALLNILPGEEFKPGGAESPVPLILAALLASVGLPYFLLSATGPLLQQWYAASLPGRSPYRLYALSNIGSLLALLSYPFLFEPLLGMSRQAGWWMWGFCAFALLCGSCAVIVSRHGRHFPSIKTDVAAEGDDSSGGRVWQWFGLSMIASVLLLATTNQICLDVAVVPFLWVAPLSLYLLTFILCFDSDRWYSRKVCGLGGAVFLVVTAFLMHQTAATSVVVQAACAFAAMFFACMVCHGELVRRKPGPARLTLFYLTIAAGGAAGGLLVAVIAPLVFPLYLEMHLALAICLALCLQAYFQEKREQGESTPRFFPVAATAVTAVIALSLAVEARGVVAGSTDIKRNFYGVLRVEDQPASEPEESTRNLRYGRILHGVQFLAEDRRRMATAYFGPDSGIGRLTRVLNQRRTTARVGIVGLGVGTLAAYGRPGDVYRFYEINPDVIELAEQRFSFLADSEATVEVVEGDARLSLEREPQQNYDLLILDAFSGDAVPSHLLTREAMDVYQRQLAPGGVLAIHISNLHFDLRPVTAALAESQGMPYCFLHAKGDAASAQTSSLWFAASEDESLLQAEPISELRLPKVDQRTLWTDDFSNLYHVLR